MIESTLNTLDQDDTDLLSLDRPLAEAWCAVCRIAVRLTAARSKVAKEFACVVQSRLKPLGLPGGRLTVELVSRELDRDSIAGTAPEGGVDHVEILFSANPGEEPRPLRKIASGGELSRLMLAVKTVLAGVDRVSTLVFDEIDTGVGGRLGSTLGKALAELAGHHQVICVTHLPQMASYADRQWGIRKQTERGRTQTTITRLDQTARIDELAADAARGFGRGRHPTGGEGHAQGSSGKPDQDDMNSDRQSVRRRGHDFAMRRLAALVVSLLICTAACWLWHFRRTPTGSNSTISCTWPEADPWRHSRRTSLPRITVTLCPCFYARRTCCRRVAGTLEAFPYVLGWATRATLLLAMVAGGHLVAWETGRPARGLAAMAAIGFSSVLGPAVLWYSASQALAAGTVLLLMLVMLQSWRTYHSCWRLVGGALAAVAAPLFWSAGFTAGLVGMAYLWADGRRSSRIASIPIITSSLVTAGLVWGLAGQEPAARPGSPDRSPSVLLLNIPVAAAHAAQAICEKLGLNNLGLDAPTSAPQAIVLSLAIAVLWDAFQRLVLDVRRVARFSYQSAGSCRKCSGGRQFRHDFRFSWNRDDLWQLAGTWLVRCDSAPRGRPFRRGLVVRQPRSFALRSRALPRGRELASLSILIIVFFCFSYPAPSA